MSKVSCHNLLIIFWSALVDQQIFSAVHSHFQNLILFESGIFWFLSWAELDFLVLLFVFVSNLSRGIKSGPVSQTGFLRRGSPQSTPQSFSLDFEINENIENVILFDKTHQFFHQVTLQTYSLG